MAKDRCLQSRRQEGRQRRSRRRGLRRRGQRAPLLGGGQGAARQAPRRHASTKRRDEVRGGGKKPYKQKGTGNARQGSTRAPHYVGGGKVFTPEAARLRVHVPKKVMAGALRSALSLRAKEQKIIVVDSFTLDAPRPSSSTRRSRRSARRRRCSSTRTTTTLRKSTRNLQHAKYLAPRGSTSTTCSTTRRSIMSRATLDAVTARLKGAPRTEEGAA